MRSSDDCAINSEYTLPLLVMLASLQENLRSCCRPVLYLLHQSLSRDQLRTISRLIETHPIVPGAASVAAIPRHSYFPPEAAYPLLLAEWLPETLERVLFLDADLLVLDDAAKLWETETGERVLAAVPDAAIPLCSAPRGVKDLGELGIPAHAPYLNAGVMLIRLAAWRERNITKRAYDYLRKVGDRVDFLHQEALNAVLWADWLPLDGRWNLLATLAGRPHDGSLLFHQARALAIRRATADYVMLAEDHCPPDPSWAQAILKRIAEGWDAVGPALRSGNPATLWSQSTFLLGYGQWMRPVRGGPASVLPGCNTVVRRKALLDLGPALEDGLLTGAFLLRWLRKQGCRFYLEPEAGMRHFDPSDCKGSLRELWYVGLGFGAMRTRRWPWIARALYWLGTPLTAARHWARAVTHYIRAGRQAGLNPLCLAVAALSASVWASGEAIGALKGPARVAPSVWISEIRPLAPMDA